MTNDKSPISPAGRWISFFNDLRSNPSMVGMLRSMVTGLAFAALLPAVLNAQPALLGIPSSPLGPPALLVLPAGTVITIEATEILSSGIQQQGDNFAAQLHHPLVVDGWVVARPGQTVVGRIAGAKKAGRVKGTSKLVLELEGIVLADGQQALVETELVENSGPTTHARDFAVVALTT